MNQVPPECEKVDPQRMVWLCPDNLAFLVPEDMSLPQQVAWLTEHCVSRGLRVGLLTDDMAGVEEVTRRVN